MPPAGQTHLRDHAQTDKNSMTLHPPQPADGVEASPSPGVETSTSRTTDLQWPQHTRLTAVELRDRSDVVNELTHSRRYLLHPSEPLRLSGNLFIAEDLIGGRGWICMKRGPLPASRQTPSDFDLAVEADEAGYTARLQDDDGYPWQIETYTGGTLAMTRALHQAQRSHAPARLDRRMISNTWGDRSRDARMNEAFVREEIEAAARLGIDVVQLDDGWQTGITSNSAQAAAKGGVWSGFYASDPQFWSPKPSAFPGGLEPLIELAQQRGVEVGLWFAPDSVDEFANFERDVQTVLDLHRRYGVKHFKFDSINATSPRAEQRLSAMFDQILGAAPSIVVDLDITAGTRPGYFGRLDHGPLFVANRYTDWHGYWPHQTFRMLWSLCRWVDPARLRMEVLNPRRNAEKYGDDPLAPVRTPIDLAFAPLMFAQPLGWFEMSNLHPDDADRLAAIIKVWKDIRGEMQDHTVMPIGSAPDGVRTSGLLSVSDDDASGFMLVVQGLGDAEPIALPDEVADAASRFEILAGEGKVTTRRGQLVLDGLATRGYWFGRWQRA